VPYYTAFFIRNAKLTRSSVKELNKRKGSNSTLYKHYDIVQPQAYSSMPYSYMINMLFEPFLLLSSLTEDLVSFALHIKRAV
jgi:hypothetical protein